MLYNEWSIEIYFSWLSCWFLHWSASIPWKNKHLLLQIWCKTRSGSQKARTKQVNSSLDICQQVGNFASCYYAYVQLIFSSAFRLQQSALTTWVSWYILMNIFWIETWRPDALVFLRACHVQELLFMHSINAQHKQKIFPCSNLLEVLHSFVCLCVFCCNQNSICRNVMYKKLEHMTTPVSLSSGHKPLKSLLWGLPFFFIFEKSVAFHQNKALDPLIKIALDQIDHQTGVMKSEHTDVMTEATSMHFFWWFSRECSTSFQVLEGAFRALARKNCVHTLCKFSNHTPASWAESRTAASSSESACGLVCRAMPNHVASKKLIS